MPPATSVEGFSAGNPLHAEAVSIGRNASGQAGRFGTQWARAALMPLLWLAEEACADPRAPRSFNTAFIGNAAQGADIDEFLRGNNVAPGVVRVDIYLNQLLSGRRDIEFRENPASGSVEPCLSLDLLRDLGVDLDRLHDQGRLLDPERPLDPGQSGAADAAPLCPSLPALIEQASVDYQAESLRLNLSVPQAALRRSARGYVDPALWDQGVTAGFVNYSLNASHNQVPQGLAGAGAGTSDRYFLGLRNGLNLGAWRFRNEASLTSDGESASGQSGFRGQPRYASNRTYAQHDLTRWKGQLTLGDSYSPSGIFDSVRFRGVQVASDDSMLPDSERGYAPVVRGIALSNATVEVRQNGFLLYSTQVAAGPFEISDLGSSGSNGDLSVTVIEADGQRRTYLQAFATPPLMVRKDALRYSVTAG